VTNDKALTLLTKSRFLSGLQCHKRLWLEIHESSASVSTANLQILQGREFDAVVQRLQPGVVISRDAGMLAAITQTAAILESGAPQVLYQPAFRTGDWAVTADVVRRAGTGFELVEVKAATEVKKVHIPDAAFQAMVMHKAGIPVRRVFVGHIDREFVLQRPDDYRGLMVESDITDEVEQYLPGVAGHATEFKRVMVDATAPSVAMGQQCADPYPCPYQDRCAAEAERPEYPVDLLPWGGVVVEQLLADGYLDLREVPVARLKSEKHIRVHAATVSGVPYFDAGATATLRNPSPPFAYLDFETIGMAVPKLIGTRPFEQIPFQWSVHVEHSASEIEHHEYLAIESFGDFEELVRSLCAAVPIEGKVFAYNASFEAGILRQLAARIPRYAASLQSIIDRLVDLLPITRKAYYHRDMRGSWSLKKVMPTISASLGYEHLDEVQAGDGAQLAFLELRSDEITRERSTILRQALLKYCRHDTWNIVVLRRFLCEEAF